MLFWEYYELFGIKISNCKPCRREFFVQFSSLGLFEPYFLCLLNHAPKVIRNNRFLGCYTTRRLHSTCKHSKARNRPFMRRHKNCLNVRTHHRTNTTFEIKTLRYSVSLNELSSQVHHPKNNDVNPFKGNR